VRDFYWQPKGIVAVLDTSVLVAARHAKMNRPSPSRDIVLLAGTAYNSFTSPAILDETERVLARPHLGYPVADTRRWIDTYVRHSRQVHPGIIPGDYAVALGNDPKDEPVLKTALAVSLDEDGRVAVAAAHEGAGCYIVSLDRDFAPGRNVWGWAFIRPEAFIALLRALA
jgi:predicted nucleic acid-binding protein